MRQDYQMNRTEKRRRLLRVIQSDRLLVATCRLGQVEYFARLAPVTGSKNPFKRKAA